MKNVSGTSARAVFRKINMNFCMTLLTRVYRERTITYFFIGRIFFKQERRHIETYCELSHK